MLIDGYAQRFAMLRALPSLQGWQFQESSNTDGPFDIQLSARGKLGCSLFALMDEISREMYAGEASWTVQEVGLSDRNQMVYSAQADLTVIYVEGDEVEVITY